MALLYVPGSADWNWESNERWVGDIDAWVTLSGTPTPRALLWHGWRRRSWILRLSSTLLNPSTAAFMATGWIWSVLGSRVNPSRLPGRSTEPRMSVGSGPQFSTPFASYDPFTSSLKTSQVSWLEEEASSLVTLPPAGSMRSGACFERVTWGHRTGASDVSYSRGEYPTPSATPYGSSQNEGQVAHDRPSRGTPSLETWAKRWPTPAATEHKGAAKVGQRRGQLSEAILRWPTPTAKDCDQSGNRSLETNKAHAGVSLSDAVLRGGRPDPETNEDGPNGEAEVCLNPQFVETLMGFPIGWSDCAYSGTVSFRNKPNSLSESLLHEGD